MVKFLLKISIGVFCKMYHWKQQLPNCLKCYVDLHKLYIGCSCKNNRPAPVPVCSAFVLFRLPSADSAVLSARSAKRKSMMPKSPEEWYVLVNNSSVKNVRTTVKSKRFVKGCWCPQQKENINIIEFWSAARDRGVKSLFSGNVHGKKKKPSEMGFQGTLLVTG